MRLKLVIHIEQIVPTYYLSLQFPDHHTPLACAWEPLKVLWKKELVENVIYTLS